MRDFLFRAWCTYEEKLYQDFYVDDHETYAFMHELIDSAQERYVLMQFTGLVDIKDNLIYENDIVEDSKGNCYVVVFKNGAFGYFEEKIQSFYSEEKTNVFTPLYLHLEELKVVGNIYEDKDLIKNKSL